MKKSEYLVPLVVLTAVAISLGPCFTTIAYAQLAAPLGVPPTVVVAVGYMDTEGRPGAGMCANCIPSPWCGSPGVQFIGSSTIYNGNSTDTSNCTGGDWDTGAILVTNAGASPITLTGLTVTLPLPASGSPGSPSCPLPTRPIVFSLWFGQQYYYGNAAAPAYKGGPITVPAEGGQAIFAGTSSDQAVVCPTGNYPSGPTHGTYDFDTSDSNFLSGCTPATDTVSDPRITFSVAGYANATYTDAGHTLDTGGIDTGNCSPTTTDPQWGHEYLGWRLAISTCGESCPMNQLGVATAAATTTTTPEFPALSLFATLAISVAVAALLFSKGRKRSLSPRPQP